MALKDEVRFTSPIGQRVKAWTGPRAGRTGEIKRVDGLRFVYVLFDGDTDETHYPRKDVSRVDLLKQWGRA
ncbi:hypothetical protein [Streptomyces sp. S1D4-14]|uniref:hypothetical protein n=1 Tax=Streptomyces sp. S1D4-14 TaxID=2594461 RepID=UPI001164A12F|nr:hypothetical protein [Streptomyces sp. S1D4-14]QDN64366.1 hypothetical protein FNV66_00600 [Streptomyces sp. S1D4-14]